MRSIGNEATDLALRLFARCEGLFQLAQHGVQ